MSPQKEEMGGRQDGSEGGARGLTASVKRCNVRAQYPLWPHSGDREQDDQGGGQRRPVQTC